MEGKKFSLKEIINSSISSTNGRCGRIFASSLVQYVAFLLTYFITHSFLVSFVVFGLFLPTEIKFLTNLEDDQKLESVYKIGKSFVSALLISMLFMFLFGVGALLLVFPSFIIFANYAFVFEISKNGDKNVLDAFKESRLYAKGYRGKIAWLSIIFSFILILIIGLCILFAWLFSLFISTLQVNTNIIWSFINLPMFYYVGAFIGISVFLIFVLPVELLSLSNMYGAIAQDRLYISTHKDDEGGEEEKENKDSTEKSIDEEKVENKDIKATPTDEKLDDRNDGNPTDYIF